MKPIPQLLQFLSRAATLALLAAATTAFAEPTGEPVEAQVPILAPEEQPTHPAEPAEAPLHLDVPQPADEPVAPDPAAAEPDEPAETTSGQDRTRSRRSRSGGDERVALFQDQEVGPDESVNSVVTIRGRAVNRGTIRQEFVTIMGSSENLGTILGDFVTVMGSARITGPVRGDLVVVLGGVDLDSEIAGDAVVVGGDVRFGPEGKIRGDLVAVGGRLLKPDDLGFEDRVSGEVVNVPTPFGSLFKADGPVAQYLSECILLLRPISPTLPLSLVVFGVLALLGLVLYLLLGKVGERTREAIADRPVASFFTGLLIVLGWPFFMILLISTVIGIPLAPVVMLLLGVWLLLGRAAVAISLGSRLLRGLGVASPAPILGFLVGTLVIMGLFCIPFVGMGLALILWTLELGAAFLGTVASLRREVEPPPAPASGPGSGPGAPVAPAAAAPVTQPPPAGGAVPLFGAPAAASATGDAAGSAPPPPAFGSPSPPYAAQPPPAAAPPAPGTLARLGPRVGALFIDLLLCLIISKAFGSQSLGGFVIVFTVYQTALLALRASTLGGIIFRLEVERADLRPLDGTTALVRALASILSLLPFGLGYWWAFWDPQRQTWHDKLAGTQVVERRTERGLV